MSIKIFTYCVVMLLITGILNPVGAQDTIPWRQNYKLGWNDFKASPDTSLGYGAVTNSGISCSYIFTDTSFHYDIWAFFNPKKSWKMPYVDSAALLHEQLHFDISEVFARKLRKELSLLKPGGTLIKQTARNLIQKIADQTEEMQDQYDKESDFGRNPAGQKKWQKMITAILQKK